jgi:DNA-directed RNA polymerase subunit beta'
VSGFLKKVTGTNPKFSFVQRKLLSKDQDYVARGVIGVDPELGLDQIGVPDSVLWTLYSPYVQRSLVRSGMSAEQALRAIRDKTEAASRMLDREAAQRPVVYSRAPSWHKFNIIAGYPKRIHGDMIRINPLVTTGLNADFDGDTINVHLPALPESVQESKDKLLPSKMLFSIKDRQKVMATPKQEFIMGLYNAQRRPARKVVDFPDEASALAAIKNGQVAMSDEVTIKGKP